MTKMKQLSKAETLLYLKKKIKSKNILILDQISFTKTEYYKNSQKILLSIKKKFKKKKIIIRSSALDEDNNVTLAGKYKSYLNLSSQDKNLDKYIQNIIKDFSNPKDQIFIQKFINNVNFAGVLFTKEPKNGSPYYVINYDYSKKTNLITSGENNPTMNILNIYNKYLKINNKFFQLISATRKIEKLFPNNSLDIEFAKKNKSLYIFQCRKLNIKKNLSNNYDNELLGIKKKIKKIFSKNPTLYGDTSVLSNMADWNPAEMIGSISTKFSSSLYKTLITDSIWSQQRKNYGYKNVWPNPLLINIANHNYIDIRADLNSFLPAKLNSSISKKVISASLEKLKKKKYLHDKIEFEIIPTCFNSKLNHIYKKILTKKEIKIYKTHLSELTSNIINPNLNILKKEIELVRNIESKQKEISLSKLSKIQKVFYLVKICQKFGTLPFAGIARCAFIAKAIFNNLVEDNVLDRIKVDHFFKSIKTITNKMNLDLIKLKHNKFSKKKFLKKYGHLRPSSYSITNLSYREDFKKYFNLKMITKNKTDNKKFNFSLKEKNQANKWLKKNKLNFNFEQLIFFTKTSVYWRENAKFEFTKIIDKIFLIIIPFMKKIGIKRDDIMHLDVNILLNAFSTLNLQELTSLIKKDIDINKKEYLISKKILLPDIITDPNDAFFHHIQKTIANYIGNKAFTGQIIRLDDLKVNSTNLKNKIILIKNADPGYDFLFNYQIKGLITMYGGPNSHMAIRCNELEIPAIIGVGKNEYYKIAKSNIVQIDTYLKKCIIIN